MNIDSKKQKQNGNVHDLSAFRAAFSSVIRRVEAPPSFREVLEYRRSGAAKARVVDYAAGHPGFAHVLSMLEGDDVAEKEEEENGHTT